MPGRRRGRTRGGHAAHQDFLICVLRRNLASDLALADRVDPVADAEQLRQLRRNHHHALALVGQRVDELVNLVLRPHVDTAGWLVQDQDLGVGIHPLGQHDLLLVTTRQRRDSDIDARGLDSEVLAIPLCHLRLLAEAEQTPQDEILEVRRHRRGFDGIQQVETEVLAVLCHIGDALLDGVGDRARRDLLTLEPDLAREVVAVGASEERPGEFSSSCPHEARETDHLPASDGEVGVVADEASANLGMLDGPILDLEERLPDLRLVMRVAVLDRTPHHRSNDAVLVHVARHHIVGLDRVAVPDDGDGVRYGGDLVELVGNHDAGDSPGLQPAHQIEQVGRIIFVQGRGRLVEDQELHILRQRLGDFDELLLTDPEALDRGLRVEIQSDTSEKLDGLQPGGFPIDEEPFADLGTKEDVLRHRQLGHKRQFLMDDDDAPLLGGANVGELHLLALVDDLTGVGAVGIDP